MQALLQDFVVQEPTASREVQSARYKKQLQQHPHSSAVFAVEHPKIALGHAPRRPIANFSNYQIRERGK
jgi:hypothetical protein